MRHILYVLLIGCLCLSLSACTKRVKKDPRQLTALVSIEGSDTMTALVQAWADNFMKNEPGVPISVNSGDSGAGIDALINRTTDLAAASRDLSDAETAQLHAKSIKLKKITVARDSIAIIVNHANPVSVLTLEQAKNIFAGSVKNWSAVGGDKSAIQVFTREEKSGTYNFVKAHLLQNADYAEGAQTVHSGKDLLSAIEKNKSAVGYVGMGTASEAGGKVKVLALKLSPDSEPVKPTEHSTVTDYPLSRPLIFFMDEEPKPSVRKFVDYCLGAEAQKLVRAEGYAPVE
ncbi:MAG TPA: phosphate ABC transporter substrate-binding protein [Drouetiella sp.]|jgi:phosphate transport system substrate-binding protein